MALTGRAALLALLGVLPVLVLPSGWTVVAVAVLLLVVALVDVALAAPVGALRLTPALSASRRAAPNPAAHRAAVLVPGGATPSDN